MNLWKSNKWFKKISSDYFNKIKSVCGSQAAAVGGGDASFVPVWGDEDGLRATNACRIGHERSQSRIGAAQQRLRFPGHLLPLRLKHVLPGSIGSHLHHVNVATGHFLLVLSRKINMQRMEKRDRECLPLAQRNQSKLNQTKLVIWECSCWEEKF